MKAAGMEERLSSEAKTFPRQEGWREESVEEATTLVSELLEKDLSAQDLTPMLEDEKLKKTWS